MSSSALPGTERSVVRDLGGGLEEALDLHDRVTGIDDVEVGDGRHARGHVVSCDDVPGRDDQRDGAQVDADQRVDDRDEQDQSRALLAYQAAETEHHAPFVLAQHANR